MALLIADRVRETSTTTGTGTYTVAGAEVGFRTFSTAIGNGNTCPYVAVMGANWETGVGTVAAGTLARTSVVASSNGNNPVNWAAGTKQIFCAPHAAILPLLTLANSWRANQTLLGVSQDITLEVRVDGDNTPRLGFRKANVSSHTARHYQIRLDSDGDWILRDETASADRLRVSFDGHITPGVGAVQDLGDNDLRYRTVYVSESILAQKTGDVLIEARAVGDNTPRFQLRKTGVTGHTARDWQWAINSTGQFVLRDETITTPRLIITTTGSVASGADNSQSLGTSTNRWTEVWAALGAIQTSDERDKEAIEDAELGLDLILRLRPVSYRWREGEDQRRHHGLIAQEMVLALGGQEFGGLRHDVEADRYGLSYAELVPVLIKGMQEQQAQIGALEKRLATLELQMAQLR